MPLSSDAVVAAEAAAIHGGGRPPDEEKVRPSVGGEALYRALHECNSSALCLSGGGIRSAAFALGVIEALAVHPRPSGSAAEGARETGSPERSFLAQIDYLSTVSGGGYIGSWLSASIARAGYPRVWRWLTGRRRHPDEEPAEIAWLRAYCGYLKPPMGLFSADAWTTIALYARNLVLNWLVVLPALCIVLLAIKSETVLSYWLATKPGYQELI